VVGKPFVFCLTDKNIHLGGLKINFYLIFMKDKKAFFATDLLFDQ
jgi:hypothetical protein